MYYLDYLNDIKIYNPKGVVYESIFSSPLVIDNNIFKNSTKFIIIEISLALSVFITSVNGIESILLFIDFLFN